jgi:hypothetical protein
LIACFALISAGGAKRGLIEESLISIISISEKVKLEFALLALNDGGLIDYKNHIGV